MSHKPSRRNGTLEGHSVQISGGECGDERREWVSGRTIVGFGGFREGTFISIVDVKVARAAMWLEYMEVGAVTLVV